MKKDNFKGWVWGFLYYFILQSWKSWHIVVCYYPAIPTEEFHGENLYVAVRIRIVSMDVNFRPLNETVSLLTMGEVGRRGKNLKPAFWRTRNSYEILKSATKRSHQSTTAGEKREFSSSTTFLK